MLGDGKGVDFYKLFNVVKGKGGYDAVCDSKSWDEVALESGLDSSVGSSVKLLYTKYLSALDSWLKEVAGCGVGGKVPADYAVVDSRDKFRNQMMQLHNGFAGLMEDFTNENNEASNGGGGEKFKSNLDECQDGKEVSPGDGVVGVSLESNGDKGVENGGHSDVETTKCVVNESVFERYCKGFDDKHAMYVLEEYGEMEVPAKAAMDVTDGDSMPRQFGISQRTDNEDIDELMPFIRSDSDEDSDDVVSSRKRKRDALADLLSSVSSVSYDKMKTDPVKDMLRWVSGVASNPCDPIVGLVHEKSKGKSYGGEAERKKVLLLREATFAKRSFESRTEQNYWLSQKSHPSLYDENPEATNKFKERMRSDKNISTGKSTAPVRSSSESLAEAEGGMDRAPSPRTKNRAEKQPLHSSNAPSRHNGRPRLLTHIGPRYQAVLPDWTGMPSESDPKWYGTRIWPSENASSRLLIERDPMGKGRQDSCGCPAPGSEECVRFHISDKRAKVKLELGLAFNEFSFDKIGEEVRRLWTKDEEKKFKDVVQSVISSSQSNDKFFWDDIFRSFPKRSREDLVSYYYNVFLYQRRGYQNRNTPDAICSDDEESDMRRTFGRITQKPGNQRQKSRRSVLLTPKKQQSKGR